MKSTPAAAWDAISASISSSVKSAGSPPPARCRWAMPYRGTVPSGKGVPGQDVLADGGQIAGRGQIHDGVGPGFLGELGLFELHDHVGDQHGGADVGIDLDAGRLADDGGEDVLVGRIGQDDHADRQSTAASMVSWDRLSAWARVAPWLRSRAARGLFLARMDIGLP